MTKTQDIMALDAAKAAALIKSTAESTANNLNISYIQKDVAEIKENIGQLRKDIGYLQKVVYMGLGGLTVLSFLLKFFL